jgi:hypothetical protein
MKKRERKKEVKGVSKGAPSGLVISLLVHAGAFVLAGLLVVFTVVKKEEVSFVPPPVIERPKMKLKKPKVKVKKASKPASPTRIMAKVSKTAMPEMLLPSIGGAGTGFGGGIGGLGGMDTMPDLSETTVFGGGQSIGNDFVGTFYDFKRGTSGRTISMDDSAFVAAVGKFVNNGWKSRDLSKYYKSPKQLYATTFMIPTVPSSVGPFSFGERDTVGWCWMVHYKGKLVHTEDIKFRFWGQGDDILLIRVDGKVVLNGSWPGGRWDTQNSVCSMWKSTAPSNRSNRLGNNMAEGGEWINLKAGEPLDMEVIFGEVPGGHFDALVCVQVEGVDYPINKWGGPIYPMFATEEPSHDLLDQIIPLMTPGEASLTNGPVFKDY